MAPFKLVSNLVDHDAITAFPSVQPGAAGSGIPLIKSYLNGVRIPGLLSLRAFIAKTVGVVLSILGGLTCDKVRSGLAIPTVHFPKQIYQSEETYWD